MNRSGLPMLAGGICNSQSSQGPFACSFVSSKKKIGLLLTFVLKQKRKSYLSSGILRSFITFLSGNIEEKIHTPCQQWPLTGNKWNMEGPRSRPEGSRILWIFTPSDRFWSLSCRVSYEYTAYLQGVTWPECDTNDSPPRSNTRGSIYPFFHKLSWNSA